MRCRHWQRSVETHLTPAIDLVPEGLEHVSVLRETGSSVNSVQGRKSEGSAVYLRQRSVQAHPAPSAHLVPHCFFLNMCLSIGRHSAGEVIHVFGEVLAHITTLSVDPSSQNLSQNRQCRDTVTCLPTHTEQEFVTVAKFRIIRTRNGSFVRPLPPTHQ